jgi:hypothetical protein
VTPRATQDEQTGTAGVSEVTAAFQRLGWGVVENTRHDLGTDLFVLARDERLFDLGLVVGVQVKSGASYFARPAKDDEGILRGWWFRDSDRAHIDAWLAHSLPHLIVLHDLDSNTSYWEHVTLDTVESTGKGAKILVPLTNTLDEGHRDALLGVAAWTRQGTTWEGSAWSGASSILPDDLLRHALLVPRLVAPHPNAGHRLAPNAEQAIAMLIQARLQELEQVATDHAEVPSIDEAHTSTDWKWRFFGALGRRVLSGEIDGLIAVITDAPTPGDRAASTIAASSGLLDEGKADESIAVIESTMAQDDHAPVDHAWLLLHHSRGCAQVGRLDETRLEAIEVQGLRTTHAHDVTATAIAGVGAVLLFDVAGFGQGDLAGAITGMDTAASWWRTQTEATGLAALTRRTFESWARDSTVTFGGRDVANNQLFSACLTADFLGDHGDWRHLSALLAQDALIRLDRGADPVIAQQGLGALRLAGDEKALKLAVRRLASNGPARAITLAATEVDLRFSTRTSGPCDLALLEQGGDLLDEQTANRSLEWLLAAVADPAEFVARTTPSYLVDIRIIDTLGAVLLAASLDRQESVMTRLTELTPQEHQLLAISWARVVQALPEHLWDEPRALLVGATAGTHSEVLQLAFLGVASPFDDAAKTQLTDMARGGSLDALSALGDVRELSTDLVASIIDGLIEHVNKMVSDANAGAFSPGAHFGSGLALLNVWHPDVAQWEPLLDLLKDQAVPGSQKAAALGVLSSLGDQLPADVRPLLEEVALEIPRHSDPDPFPLFGYGGDASGAATELAASLGALDEAATASGLLLLLSGEPKQREWAARVARRLGRPEDTGVLVTLAQDPEPEVRAAAAVGLALMVAGGAGGADASNALKRCASDPGVQVPGSIVNTLSGTPSSNAASREALTDLLNSPSSYTRATAVNADRKGEHLRPRTR